jgi:hypothetical protein
MKKASTLAICLVCALAATAQPNSALPKNIRAANTLENLFDANGLSTSDNLYGIPLEPGRIVGNAYLSSHWKRTAFLLYDGDKMIEGYPARYEIDQDQFEIKAAGGVKVLNGKRVKSFVWVDSLTKAPHYFVNGKDLTNTENVPMAGFYEVLTEGALTLLLKTEVIVKKPTYNEKLDVGNRDQRIVKKAVFWYSENGKIKELSSSRKKFFPVFGKHEEAIHEFIRVNSLSLDRPEHMKAIFDQYNKRAAIN